MTVSAKTIVELAIQHLNETSADGTELAMSDETQLLSSDSSIDSLSLVRLLLEIERLAEEDYNSAITVVDEAAFEAEVSPLRTVGSLKQHVERLLASA